MVHVPMNSKDPAIDVALFRRRIFALMCVNFHPQDSFRVFKLMLFDIAHYLRLES